jgi:hypothetical protein
MPRILTPRIKPEPPWGRNAEIGAEIGTQNPENGKLLTAYLVLNTFEPIWKSALQQQDSGDHVSPNLTQRRSDAT